MFPMEFDRRLLSSLPLPTEEGIKTLSLVLKALVVRRVLPYFRRKRGTDPIQLARAGEELSVRRMEDEENGITVVSLISRG
jgi:hypothetical protein